MKGGISALKFNEKGLVPAIAQDASTGEVLMMAWMNAEAVEKTLSTGKAHYYSRSRNSLWLKGETSGNFQEVREVLYDCDGDTLLVLVEPKGPACHTGERTCFYRSLAAGENVKPAGPAVISQLAKVLEERKKADPSSSYVASLYAKGLPKILAKVEEETYELVEAASEKENGQVLYEFCDLLFHSMALLAHKGIKIDEVFTELGRRYGTSGIEEKNSRAKK
ncbi:phosphoribosyl-ATP pyrophosphohydrolase / phosphoribosyl-AMP cyclohydrolase [uncultured bacterium]|nr:phosphoribosyl-ATP pyrophosphohydrolase / phosphoribosyl-AMP cyclohydrolase [uncultured bacterium]